VRRFLYILAFVVTALVALVVSAMNASLVEIELAFARVKSPLGVALVVAFVIGLLIGLAWQMRWVTQLLSERGRLRRALRLAESKARGEPQAS
jgi:uncharacterized integral membrane protein